MDEIIFKIGKTEVVCEPDLLGGGDAQSPWWIDYVSHRFPRKRFGCCLDWCSGPGCIGFSLLESNLCESLVLVDINERVIDCVRRTVERNKHLQGKVTYYVSDNLAAVPASAKFDLIVSSAPCYHTPQQVSFPREVISTGTPITHNSLLASDPGWKIHREFFRQLPPHLNPGAVALISEFEPLEHEARLYPGAKEIVDFRPRAPILDFYEMIRESGLFLRELAWAGPRDPAMPNPRVTGATDLELRRKMNAGDHFWVLVVTPNRGTPLE